MQLSIIIVNYNVRHYLRQCLLSVLRAAEGMEAEVIVVDNQSKDGSVEMLSQEFGGQLKLIANADNPGFSKANNQGIAISKGKYVLLLNPDTLVPEDCFRLCWDFMEAHPDAGGLGIKMLDGQGVFLPESKRALPTPWVSFYKIFGLSALFPQSPRFAKYHLTYLDKNQNQEVEILSGAFMLMRKEVLDQIGYLDETFFMYGEDIDLSYRIVLAGYKNYYFADSQILHYKGESTKKGSLNYVKVFYQAMLIFANKHFAGNHQRLFILMIRLAVYLRAAGAVLFRFVKWGGFQLVEGLLFWLSIFGIKEYWEHNIKYIEGGQYPPTFDYVAAPIYTVVFVLFLSLAGAYRKPFRISPLITATLGAFIALATVSFVFPGINFSRAIVGLSAVFAFIIAITTRGILNMREKRNFFFTEVSKKRTLIVADETEYQRVSGFLPHTSDYPLEVLGFVSPQASRHTLALGHISQLPSLISLLEVEELIFCNGSLPTREILKWQELLNGKGVSFKIVPPQSELLIGSQFIYVPQQQKTAFTRLSLTKYRNEKRYFDICAASTLLLLSPVLMLFYRKPLHTLRRLWQILRGKLTFVGYLPETDLSALPPLAAGIFAMPDKLKMSDEKLSHPNMNAFYARHYHWTMDLGIVLRNWRDLGR